MCTGMVHKDTSVKESSVNQMWTGRGSRCSLVLWDPRLYILYAVINIPCYNNKLI